MCSNKGEPATCISAAHNALLSSSLRATFLSFSPPFRPPPPSLPLSYSPYSNHLLLLLSRSLLDPCRFSLFVSSTLHATEVTFGRNVLLSGVRKETARLFSVALSSPSVAQLAVYLRDNETTLREITSPCIFSYSIVRATIRTIYRERRQSSKKVFIGPRD